MHLVSKEGTPEDSFAGGTIIRLREPRHVDDEDDRSPIVAGYVTVGAEGSELFVGSLVAAAQLTGRWRILTMGDTMTAISQDRPAPYRRGIVSHDVTEQFAQRLKVYAPHDDITTDVFRATSRSEYAHRTPRVSNTRIEGPGTRDAPPRDRRDGLLRAR